MPIYDYRCLDCGRVVELLVRGASSEGTGCPTCHGTRLEKLPSAGHILKSHRPVGSTCCGPEDRCETLPCFNSEGCCRG